MNLHNFYIATPAYGAIDPRAAHAFATTIATLAAAGHGVSWDLECFDPNQARARNILFDRFLRSGAELLWMVDKDMIVHPEIALRLIEVGGDAVSAAYEKKRIGAGCVGQALVGADQIGSMIPMARVGFGCLMLSRACVERMAAAAPRSFRCDVGASVGQMIPEIVRQDIGADGEWLSVDWYFSDGWRALGGELWLHADLSVGHVGTQVYGETALRTGE